MMIAEGYAWAYDGGTKQKDFEESVKSVVLMDTCMISLYLTVAIFVLMVAYAGMENTIRFLLILISNSDTYPLEYEWN